MLTQYKLLAFGEICSLDFDGLIKSGWLFILLGSCIHKVARGLRLEIIHRVCMGAGLVRFC